MVAFFDCHLQKALLSEAKHFFNKLLLSSKEERNKAVPAKWLLLNTTFPDQWRLCLDHVTTLTPLLSLVDKYTLEDTSKKSSCKRVTNSHYQIHLATTLIPPNVSTFNQQK